MCDNNHPCPCPDPEELVSASLHCSSVSICGNLNIGKDLFKDYPTRNEVEEKIQDAKDELDGKIDDTRTGLEEKIREAAEEADAKFVPQTRVINTVGPLTGGGALDHDLTLGIAPGPEGTFLTVENGRLVWKAINPYELCEFYFFRHPTLRAGFQLAQGGLLANAATLYPEAWAYLQTAEGQKLCKTEAEWQAMTTATWATLANGTKVGWNGIGGAPFYAPNTATGALRLPDLRGMYAEAAGFDGLGVGGVHGDAIRRIWGNLVNTYAVGSADAGGGALQWELTGRVNANAVTSGTNMPAQMGIDSARTTPAANKNQPRAWGALACVYLGRPAS